MKNDILRNRKEFMERVVFSKADSFAFNNWEVPNKKSIFLKKYSLKQKI